MTNFKSAPFLETEFGPVDVIETKRDDGTIILESRFELERYPRVLTDRLALWAYERPDHVFLAERDDDGMWQSLSFEETYDKVRQLAQGLLERNLSNDTSIVILSENSIDHALLALAAMHIGVPYAPISPAYALASSDFVKLRHCLELLTPSLVYISDGRRYEKALKAVVSDISNAELVVSRNPPDDLITASFTELLATEATEEVEFAFETVSPFSVAKILFTSGSTSLPKAVINTQQGLSSNQQQNAQCLPFLTKQPPVLVDWTPWNHTAGSNSSFGFALYNGGSFYIDSGKPSYPLIEQSVTNLKEISPTIYFNVPKGFESLIPYLEEDAELRENFFRNLELIFYAGASLTQSVWDALESLSVKTLGKRVPIISGLGMTESGPSALLAHWSNGFSGMIGVPVPGIGIKLVPNQGKLEVRYKGPNITPGYWRQDEKTEESFDEEGFFITGDAIKYHDEHDPNKGLIFDGRIAEDFKLNTGTWVNTSKLRSKLSAKDTALIQDVVITGHDRDYLGAILFLSLAEARKRVEDSNSLSDKEILEHHLIKKDLSVILQQLKAESTSSSNRFERFIVATEPPSLEAGELTGKGSLNQRRLLESRHTLVSKLYENPVNKNVITGD